MGFTYLDTPNTSSKFTYLDNTTQQTNPTTVVNQGKSVPNNPTPMQYWITNPLKSAGQAYINDAKNIGNAISHPVETTMGIGNALTHPVDTAVNTIKNIPDTIMNHPLQTAAMVLPGAEGALAGVSKLATGAKDMAAGVPDMVNNIVAPIRDYAGNKVNAIRAGAKSYWKEETGAYGKTVDSLGNDSSSIDSGPVLENMTNQIVDRGLYDKLQGQWVKPLNRVDIQLKKSYDTLFRKSQDTGQIPMTDIIREYQNIRDSVPITSTLGKDAKTVANDFILSLSKQVNIPKLQEANARYSEFKNNFNAIDSKIDVWGNPMETAKGENYLTKGINQTKQARVTAQSIEKNTGQNLKLAKTLSTINNFPVLKWALGH